MAPAPVPPSQKVRLEAKHVVVFFVSLLISDIRLGDSVDSVAMEVAPPSGEPLCGSTAERNIFERGTNKSRLVGLLDVAGLEWNPPVVRPGTWSGELLQVTTRCVACQRSSTWHHPRHPAEQNSGKVSAFSTLTAELEHLWDSHVTDLKSM